MPMPPPQANPMMELQQMLQRQPVGPMPPVDPRTAAIEQYMQQQGQGSQMPIYSPGQVQASRGAPPPMQTDQGEVPMDDDDEADAQEINPDEMSDEQMLAHVHENMMPGETSRQGAMRNMDDREGQRQSDMKAMSHDSNSDTPSYRAWVEEHGREPITDTEMEEAYGSDEENDNDPDDRR